MLKKRLIFTLLFSEGKFSLSRNFRLQEVGDIVWLEKNYNFSQISHAIDELIIIDVSRSQFEPDAFCEIVKLLIKGCFVPITIGGKIDSLKKAKKYLNSGADKLLINSILFKNKELVQDLSEEFGEQCLVAAVDVKLQDSAYTIFTDQGTTALPVVAEELIQSILDMPVGEVLVNSIDRDGTGNGLDFGILNLLPENVNKPIIFSGGIGNYNQLYSGFENTKLDAIATANLLNFLGDGLIEARKSLIEKGVPLPIWDNNFYHTIGQKIQIE
jgi:imidazole glycerol-phosphate synthase subunit HisF